MKNIIKWISRHFGWVVPSASVPHGYMDWKSDEFFTAHRAKALRLAEIARERTALKERLAVAIKQKKARAPIYQALRALSSEELRLESGK